MAKRRTAASRPAPVTKTGAGRTEDIFNGNISDLFERFDDIYFHSPPGISQLFNEDFSGNIKNLDHAKDLFYNGSPELMEKYLKHSQSVDIKPGAVPVPVYMPSVEGLFFSVPAYLEGQPEHWINLEEAPGLNVINDLYINISAGASITEETIFNKLVNVVRFIDQKEAAGERFNIFLCFNATPSKDNPDQTALNFTIKIKNDSEPVNLQQILFLVATPVLLRFGFIFLNTSNVGREYAGHYYQDQEKEMINIRRTDLIYIPSMYYDKLRRINDYSDLNYIYPHLVN